MSSDNTGECAETQTEEERQSLWDKTEQWLFSEPLWALVHALFWAVTRDRKEMAKYFAEGEPAESGDPPIPLTTVVSVLKRRGFVHADIRELEAAARRGAITIEGREDGEPNWKQIPWGDWAGGPSSGGLEVLEHDSGAPYAASKFGVRPRRTWTDLRVSREQVMSAFPVTEDPDRTGEPYAPSAATQPLEQDQWQEPAANPMHKQDPNPAPPRTLAEEVALVARDLKIKAPMRLSEKITAIEAWFNGEERTPPGRTTIKTGLKLAGLNNPRRRGR